MVAFHTAVWAMQGLIHIDQIAGGFMLLAKITVILLLYVYVHKTVNSE